MHRGILYIYKNTPLGREILLQSIFFSKKIDSPLFIYIPKFKQFNMYFEDRVVSVTLDSSYFRSPDTAYDRVKKILKEQNATAEFLEPEEFSASTLPDIPVSFSFMISPRVISAHLSKFSFGSIGKVVRNILLSSQFPVLLSSYCFKEWNKIYVMFGGSHNALNAFKVGYFLSKRTKDPLYLFTQQENKRPLSYYEEIIKENGLEEELKTVKDWLFFDTHEFEDNLFEIPPDALVVIGLFGHGLIKDVMFGSKMEIVQRELPNNLLVVGPHFKRFFV